MSSWNAGADPQGGACISCAIHTALLIEYSGTNNKAGAGAAVAFLFLFITFFAPGVDVSEYTGPLLPFAPAHPQRAMCAAQRSTRRI